MKLTTHFRLHSQATRLDGVGSYSAVSQVTDGAFTLSGTLFQERIYTWVHTEPAPLGHNSTAEDRRFSA